MNRPLAVSGLVEFEFWVHVNESWSNAARIAQSNRLEMSLKMKGHGCEKKQTERLRVDGGGIQKK